MSSDNFLKAVENLVRKASENLAIVTTVDGSVSVEKLDNHQLAAYDLAYIWAEIEAAKSVLEHQGGEIESKLADFFLADVIVDVHHRLAARLADFKLSDKDLEDVFALESLRSRVRHPVAPSSCQKITELLRGSSGGASYGLDSDHEEIRKLFRKFAETRVAPLAEKIHRENADIPEEIIKGLAEMGCFGLSIPQRYEGFQDDANPDNLGMVLATEELSRVSLGVAGSLVTRPEILAKALLKGGTANQKTKWLPEIATGKKMVSVAVTEPDYGCDVASIVVKAQPVQDGWTISGTKMWCTFAGRSEILMVLARTDPDKSKKYKGLSAFIVEKSAFSGHSFEYTQPGGGKISGRDIACIGYRGMHTFEVVFDNYFVPEENLIGGKEGLGKGFYLQMEGFAGGRLQTAARANGVSQAAFESALNYAQARHVFGKPIIDYQLTQWKLSRMAALIHASRQLSYKVAKLFNGGQGQMEASLVKLFAGRVAEWVTREATQIHGAMGYAEETSVSRYFVDARVFSIFEGAEEILALRVIAKNILEQALKEQKAAASV